MRQFQVLIYQEINDSPHVNSSFITSTPPAMYDAPDPTTVVTGSSASLTCVVSTSQEATITWSTTLDSDISTGVATSFNSVRYTFSRFVCLGSGVTIWNSGSRYFAR